jgi:hypothetical protein
MANFILLGGPEHLDWFENPNAVEFSNCDYFWTCPKTAAVGDVGFIYLTAPVSRIVGKVRIVGEPFYQVGDIMFENPKMRNKYCAEVEFAEYYPSANLTIKNLRSLFQDWGWLTMPRSNTRIPDSVLPAFLELIEGCK